MDEFVKKISQEHGIDEAKVNEVMNKVLQIIKGSAPQDVRETIEENVRQDTNAAAPASNNPCMPVLDLLKNLLAKFGGEKAVGIFEGGQLAEIMAKSGISLEQGTSMVQKLMDFLREKCGPETADKVLEQVPAVKSFIGSA